MKIFTDEFKEKVNDVVSSKKFAVVTTAITTAMLVVFAVGVSNTGSINTKLVEGIEMSEVVESTNKQTNDTDTIEINTIETIDTTGETEITNNVVDTETTVPEAPKEDALTGWLNRKFAQLDGLIETIQGGALPICALASILLLIMWLFGGFRRGSFGGLAVVFIPLIAYALIVNAHVILPAFATWVAA